MKLISLNTWGGRAGKEKLLEFFQKNKHVDIFCLQEISYAPNSYLGKHSLKETNISSTDDLMISGQDISAVLTDHVAYFRPHYLDNYGLLLLVKKDLKVLQEGDFFVHKERGYVPKGDVGFHARNVQYATITTENGDRTVMNFHGLWNGGGKLDTDDRLTQAERIIDFMKLIINPYIICGDFNLLPDTKSFKKIEGFGLRNLIKEYGVMSTRTSYYTKEHKFADYVLTSTGVKVNDFKVLPDEVSDHSPIYLEFN